MSAVNLLSGAWSSQNAGVQARTENEKVVFKNESDAEALLSFDRGIPYEQSFMRIVFEGTNTLGGGAAFTLVDDLTPLDDYFPRRASLNSLSIFPTEDALEGKAVIILPPQSETEVTTLTIEFFAEERERDEFLLENLSNDILVITPSYPTPENPYLAGFVHSRLKAYKDAGINFDLICSHAYKGDCSYTFEGIKVLRVPYFDLRTILRRHKYKKILVHFFDEKYGLVFDSCDLGDAELFFWCHNPETRYWDSPYYSAEYFKPIYPLSEEQKKVYLKKDTLIKRYNDNPHVTWIFISEMQKKRSEELIGIRFNKSRVIPNLVDEHTFDYVVKDPELRKKIFFARRFDNLASYSIDTAVRCIVELSRRPFFNELEFNIYGYGNFYDELVEPLLDFDNVHLHRYFLNHDDMPKVHKEHGIALFPSRFDSQGVSACEAAMSGLAVMSSTIDAAEYFLPNDMGLLNDPDDYFQHADTIERLYEDPVYFLKCSQACHEKVYGHCRREKTVDEEINLIQAPHIVDTEVKTVSQEEALLSIVIPSYNVSDYLAHGVETLLNQDNAKLLEIIIVNDGSQDATPQIAQSLMNTYNDPDAPIISLINKENGGHGSTINAGLAAATGKYFKIMDGDDWFDSEQLKLLLDTLSHETSDIVLMDYTEDRAILGELIPKYLYEFMIAGLQYEVDDVCTGAYGFKEFGPIIATACFKTQMLKDTNFTLSEHCYYVDVEFDMYNILKAETIVYYPLNVYRYYIGRMGQSVSRPSFIRNQKDHRRIIGNILSYMYEHPEISQAKRDYIINNLVVPVAKTHYTIVSEWQPRSEDFREFDTLLSQWPDVYNREELSSLFIRLHRKTSGRLLPFNPLLIRLNEWQKRVRKT